MVVSYKSKFIKVFISSVILILLSILGTYWLVNETSSLARGINVSDSSLMLIKWMVYLIGPVAIIGYGLYFYSHYLLAKAKGYSAWFTLLGFISTFGILILFLLPDRRKLG